MSEDNKVEEVVAEVQETVEKVGRQFNKGFNQYHYAIVVALIAIGFTLMIALNGFASPANIAATIAAQINGIALFFISFFSCILVLMGVKVDVYKELIEEHNTALAIFLLGIAYGIASIISKAAL